MGDARRRAGARAAVLAVAGVLALSACGADRTEDPTGSTEDPEGGDDFTVVGAIAEIPATAPSSESVVLSAADLDAVCEANGCERPGSVEDEDAVRAWVDALTAGGADAGGTVAVQLPEMFLATHSTHAELAEQLGWSLVDVGSYVALDLPPALFVVAQGPDQLSPDLVETGDGIWSTGDGEDLAVDPQNGTPADRLGRVVRLAQAEDRVALSLNTGPLTQWAAGTGTTLADDEQLRTLAEALDDADAVSAVLARNDFASDSGSAQLAPFEAVAIGWSGAEDAAVTLAYGTGSAEGAQDLADSLTTLLDEDSGTVSDATGAPLADYLTLDDVSVDGAVAVATVQLTEGTSPDVVLRMLASRDVLFGHR